jgi:hypothetical protein
MKEKLAMHIQGGETGNKNKNVM